jgi:hypothetical protein
MTPTLASQITVSQFQIPFGDIKFTKIPSNGMYLWEHRGTVPLHGVRKIPMNHDKIGAWRESVRDSI